MLCSSCFQAKVFGSNDHADINILKAEYTLKANLVLEDFDRNSGLAEIHITNIGIVVPVGGVDLTRLPLA